ncbi:hypothetical protein OG225_41945 (plasmid) [Nocardia sp. NBC_01377]|uniref:hypothetical protein n=1 Tax=Nocardia sp. NBC_01377 TaxID=2903595 RepID=UPI002F909517
MSEWPSLTAIPTGTISSALSALSQFCGLRIVRFRDLDTTFLAFEDPETGRFYEVGHGLSRWLDGQKKSPGSPSSWVGDPLHELRPGDFNETSPHDYTRHDTAEPAGA